MQRSFFVPPGRTTPGPNLYLMATEHLFAKIYFYPARHIVILLPADN